MYNLRHTNEHIFNILKTKQELYSYFLCAYAQMPLL